MTPASDPFPASEFDLWADQYDRDVNQDGFPFSGYRQVLTEIVHLAGARPGMDILDLGVGTGNLAALFAPLGVELWCIDYSDKMLEHARAKLPAAHFYSHDVRRYLPSALNRRFDRIVSAYVFHHFELDEKIAIIERLVRDHLSPDGRLLIADISFQTHPERDAQRESAGDTWGEEPYWVAAEALPALAAIGVDVTYNQLSECAGIYRISPTS
jgi:putative AdoMet-dependent methyltransferase